MSNSLKNTLQNLLAHAKKLGMDQAEVSASQDTGFSVNVRMGEVETVEHHQEKNLDITVYQDHRRGSTSTSDFSPDALTAALEKACAIARYTQPDPFAGLADADLMATNYPDLDTYHPWEITPQAAIKMALECEDIARAQDTRIKNSEGASVSTGGSHSIYANSHGFVGEYSVSEHALSCSLVAETNKEMQRDYEYSVARNAKNLWPLEKVAKLAAEKTLRRLNARKINTCQCPVVFDASTAKSLLKTFIAAISGSNLYRGTSFLRDHLEKPIFSSNIHIYQDPFFKDGIGSFPFDDEGVATKKIDYVKNGILKSYAMGSYSARKLGLKSTGNAGGIYNLFIEPADLEFDALLKKMGTGLLVTELIGQGINLMTGDYSRGAFGFWVKNGEIQHPVEEITIAGNLHDMFKNLEFLSNDVDHRGNIHTGSILIPQMTLAGN